MQRNTVVAEKQRVQTSYADAVRQTATRAKLLFRYAADPLMSQLPPKVPREVRICCYAGSRRVKQDSPSSISHLDGRHFLDIKRIPLHKWQKFHVSERYMKAVLIALLLISQLTRFQSSTDCNVRDTRRLRRIKVSFLERAQGLHIVARIYSAYFLLD